MELYLNKDKESFSFFELSPVGPSPSSLQGGPQAVITAPLICLENGFKAHTVMKLASDCVQPWCVTFFKHVGEQGIAKQKFFGNIANRYLVSPNKLGEGAYGTVYLAYDSCDHWSPVAIKVAAFDEDSRIVALRSMSLVKEVRVQKFFSKDSIVKSWLPTIKMVRLLENKKDLLISQGKTEDLANRVCIVSELLGQNLFDELKMRQEKRAISVDSSFFYSARELRSLAQQLLYFASRATAHGRVHADLKPENILRILNSHPPKYKIGDFGSSFSLDGKEPNQQSKIQSLWFRAPEVVLGQPLTTAIDVWSIGCILYELCTGRAPFASKTEMDLLLQQWIVCGAPTQSFLKQSSSQALSDFFSVDEEGGDYVLKIDQQSSSMSYLSSSSDLLDTSGKEDNECVAEGWTGKQWRDFLALLRGLLTIDPEQRMTAEKALSSAFIVPQTYSLWG